MKKTDIAMIIFIATISIVIAYFVANAIFGNISKGSVTVKTIDPIDAKIVDPSPEIFNSGAINPAVQVQISGGTATQTTGTK